MRSIVFMLVAWCLGAAETPAASLAGKVLDPSGSIVRGAEIRLTHISSGLVRRAVTDHEGRYELKDLPSGVYEVVTEGAGFAPYRREDLALQSGRRAVFDVVLTLPVVAELVTVTAKAPAGEGEFERRPHNTREFLELREVRESGAKDVGEAAASLEGLWKIRKGGIANDIVLRGFQQGNLNVLIDDVRISAACPNHMDPAAFHADFAEIESLQVTKGPFDIRNQGSLGGTVNIVSKKAADALRVSPNFAAASFGFYNPSLNGSYALGPLAVSGGYSYRRADPYRDGAGRRVTDYANYTAAGRSSSAFDVNTGWVKSEVALPRYQTLDFNYTRQQGGLTLYPYLLMDAAYDDADRASANWSVRELTGIVRQVHAQAYFTRVKHWMTDELRASSAGAPLGFSMATFAATKMLGGRVEAELPGTIAGLELYQRDWNAVNTMRMAGNYVDQPSIPGVRMRVAGLYLQHRRTFGKLQLTAGGRLDRASSDARAARLNTDIYFAYQGVRLTSSNDVNPSGNLWIAYALPKGIELFAGFGSSVRLPDPQERYFALRRGGSDWVGNPALAPTRNNELDLGINIRVRRVTLRPTIFYSRLDNFVALHPRAIQNPTAGIMNTVARSYENLDARMRGGELSYSIGFSRSLLLAGGVSYVRGAQTGGPMAEIPPLKSRTSLRYGNQLFFAEVEGRAIARQDRVDRLLGEQPTPGYGLLGLRGGVHHKRVNFAAGIDNLLNRFYYDHLAFYRDPFRTGVRIPDPGRTLYVNLSFVLE